MLNRVASVLGIVGLGAALCACGSDGDGGGSTTGGTTSGTSSTTTTGSGGGGTGGGAGGAGGGAGGSLPCEDLGAPDEVVAGTTDPEAGDFTLDEALAGIDGPGPLRAIVTTEKGEITCELFPEKAPNGVANFVGLARGLRAWKDPTTSQWVRRRFYDGLTFHRIIDDFMAQGGDPLGTGFGGPGYKFPDEISDLLHQPGTLAYANSGPNSNGSQFYITEVTTDWLDGGYVIFGQCAPMSVIQTITALPTDANDHPLEDVHTLTVRISLCAP